MSSAPLHIKIKMHDDLHIKMKTFKTEWNRDFFLIRIDKLKYNLLMLWENNQDGVMCCGATGSEVAYFTMTSCLDVFYHSNLPTL